MNLGIFGGRIGRDAEKKQLTGGDTVCNWPLAVDVGNKAEPKTMWVDCSLWGKRGDVLVNYLTKGSKVTVTGRLVVEEFKKKDGSIGYRVHLNVSDVDLHGVNQGSGSASPAGETSAGAKRALDDSIPF